MTYPTDRGGHTPPPPPPCRVLLPLLLPVLLDHELPAISSPSSSSAWHPFRPGGAPSTWNARGWELDTQGQSSPPLPFLAPRFLERSPLELRALLRDAVFCFTMLSPVHFAPGR